MGPAAARHITRKIYSFEEQEKTQIRSCGCCEHHITFELNGLWLGVHSLLDFAYAYVV
jgi:hypothetical protein